MATHAKTCDDLDTTLDRIMRELDAAARELPEDAIREAQKHRDQIVPRLIQSIRAATASAASGVKPEGNAHFFALFLLQEFRAAEALPAILEAISLPGELPFDLFGDAITESLASVLAALEGDTPKVLDALIQNRALNEYVRWEAAETYWYAVAEGRLSRDSAVEHLRNHLREAIVNQDTSIISFLVETLLSFSSREALDDIREAFRLDLVDETLVDLEDVEARVAAGDSDGKGTEKGTRLDSI